MIRSLRIGAAALVFVLAGCLAGEAQEPKKDNPGEKKGPGKGAPGGPGGRIGGPQPGQVLPPFLVEMLKLTDAQKKDLDALQKEVDTKLAKILTEEQMAQLKEMRNRGPGGPGGGFGKGPEGKRPPGDTPKKKDE